MNFTHVAYIKGEEIDNDFMVVVMVSGGYKDTFENYFLPTVPPDIPVVMAVFPKKQHKDLAGNTQDSLYKEHMLQRLEIYLSYIRTRPRDSKLLFLDCDITFFGLFKEELSNYLDEYDMCIQKGNIGGIMAVSCNERSELFFETLVNRCRSIAAPSRKDGFPQWTLIELIHEFVEQHKFKLLQLPEKYGFLAEDMVLYHAINGGKTVGEKNVVLSFAHKIVNNTCNDMWKKFKDDELYDSSEGKHILVVNETNGAPGAQVMLWPSWIDSITMWERLYEEEEKSEIRKLFEKKYAEMYPDGCDYSQARIYGGPGPSEYYALRTTNAEEIERLYPGTVYLAPLVV